MTLSEGPLEYRPMDNNHMLSKCRHVEFWIYKYVLRWMYGIQVRQNWLQLASKENELFSDIDWDKCRNQCAESTSIAEVKRIMWLLTTSTLTQEEPAVSDDKSSWTEVIMIEMMLKYLGPEHWNSNSVETPSKLNHGVHHHDCAKSLE